MLTLALSLMLAAGPGSGKTLVRTSPGTVVPISGSNVLAYFPFSTPGCYATGSAMGTKGQTVTVTRATTATYLDASGVLRTCQNNEARVGCEGTTCGLVIEPARTNVVTNSDAITPGSGGWSGAGDVLNASDQCAFVDGQATMDSLDANGNTSSCAFQTSTVTSSAGPFTVSAWVRSITGTAAQTVGVDCGAGTPAACTCVRSDGGACTAEIVGGSSCQAFGIFGTTPVRLSATTTCAAPVTTLYPYFVGGRRYSATGIGCFGGTQLEAGAYVSSYIPTTTPAVTRAADAITIATPWAATAPAAYSVTATATPVGGRAWAQASNPAILSGGTDGAANALRLYADGSGNLKWEVSQLVGAVSHGYAAGSSHTVCAANNAGTLSATSDASPLTLTMSGAGGTIASWPATLRLGAASTAGTEAGALISGLRFTKRGTCP